MRETFRFEDNKSYWEKRWDKIDADEMMENKESYPLKYTLETVSFNNSKQKILEAGCGAGRILSYLYNQNFNVVGIEFIESAVKKIKKKYPDIEVYTMDILKTNFSDNEFDTILAFGLYHNFQVEKFKQSLIETRRILKKGGVLCFSFRADNLQNYVLDKIKDNKLQKNKQFHKLNLKKYEIQNILKENNFKIIKNDFVINMPLLFHFKIFRSKNQKQFNEHMGRKNGYSLNLFGRILNKFLLYFFKEQYCNVHVFYCTKK
jgi:cyclopropane fatty-acyl-phospholipid synthase-like methyltransferase